MSFVYVLTNSAMPGLVKIGRTDGDDVSTRASQLYSTGVPFPFDLQFVCKVGNADEVESALHQAFGPSRVNPKREFFKIEPIQAIAILKLLHTEDTTPPVDQAQPGIDAVEVEAAKQYRNRRPNLNFEEMGIVVGSELLLDKVGAIAKVAGPKKVTLGDAIESISLSAATRQLLNLPYSVAPAPYWTCQGRNLQEIYDETYLHEA